MTATLEKEMETYRKELPKLKEKTGSYALIRGDKVLSVWSTYEDAIQMGYQTCGANQPFLVKRIETVESVLFNSRSLDPVCQH
jgi:hypothetical protein